MDIFYLILILLALHYAYFIVRVYIGLIALKKSSDLKESNELVSVIIPLRNESGNIESLCNSLNSQTLSKAKFEIIFIDDNSDDDTYEKLLKHKPDNSKILRVKNGRNNQARKKKALIEGVKNASNPIIISTDADCSFYSCWLEVMSKYFDEKTAIVAGPVDLKSDKSLFSKIQRLEFAGLILTGAGLIGINNPTICSAANFAYRKSVFEEVDGFNDQLGFTSGDDDLFLQKVASLTNYKIKFAYEKEAIVTTHPRTNVGDFLHQRKRWASKSLFYNNKLLVLKIILIFLFYLGLILQLIGGLFFDPLLFITFGLSLLVKIIVEYLVLNYGSKTLYDRKILRPFILAEFIQIPYIIISAIGGLFGNFKWKGDVLKR